MLIVTIIVVIILAAVVILTLSKNNPIESAKEARFKEDIRAIQDELSMYISKEYTKNPNTFNTQDVNFEGESLVQQFESAKKYKDKVKIVNGKVIYIGKDKNEKLWAKEIEAKVPVPIEWQKYIDEVTPDGVPIPKGFTYLEGSKEEGTVIEDENHNEFVWIPVDGVKIKYEKSTLIAGISYTEDDSLPTGINDESADVLKYGGFYIGRYESTQADYSENPTVKKDNNVWTNINYFYSKSKSESMYKGNNLSVQSGLMTGKAWDTSCEWIKDSIESLLDSREYGNYRDSQLEASNGSGKLQTAGYSKFWCKKNIYDLAGNAEEWTTEKSSFTGNNNTRGGAYYNEGSYNCIIFRQGTMRSGCYDSVGFRVRLYIKTD